MGPWSYTGTGGYSVTLIGSDFQLTTNAAPVTTGFTVKLYNQQNQWLDTRVPAGSPLSFEAPPIFIYSPADDTFSSQTTAEDGNSTYFTYNTYLEAPYGATTPVTSLVRLIDVTSGAFVTLGPFVNSNNSITGHSVTLNGASFGLAPSGTAVNHQFQEQLLDATGVTLLDQQAAQTFSYEYPANSLTSAAISVMATDPANGGAVQRFLLTLGTSGPPGINSTNYAEVIDNQNSEAVSVGPWSYTGTGGYSVTLIGSYFGLTTNAAPVSTGFTVKLYNQQNQWLDTAIPTGAPFNFEAPPAFIYVGDNAFSCTTADEDGNCVYFTYSTVLTAPFANTTPVTTLVKLENLTSSVTVTMGPFVNINGGNIAHAVTLNGASFGLAPGGTAFNQQFQEQVFDATGVTLLDQGAAPTFSYEYPTNYISASSLSCGQTAADGSCQAFTLTIDADGAPGITSTNYAYVSDTSNNESVYVGPFSYTGATSYSVTLFPDDFQVVSTSPVTANFTVQLWDESLTRNFGAYVPAGSPLTLETPPGYIYSNAFSGYVYAEDGNSVTFTFSTTLDTPGGATQNFEFALADLSDSVTQFFGPVPNPVGNHPYSVTVTGAQFLPSPGQEGVSQVFEELLFDSSGTTLLGHLDAPTLSIENNSPSATDSLSGSTLSCFLAGTGGACQSLLLTLNTTATAGVTSTNYANVTDITNGKTFLAGPWTYSGNGTLPVTLPASDFSITSASPVSASFAVTLLAGNQSTVLGTSIPAGSPLSLVAPPQYIYRYPSYNNLSPLNLAEDGNWETFTFNAYLTAAASNPVTSYLKLVDQTAPGGPVTVSVGAVTASTGTIEPAFTMLSQQFGLATPGQIAVSQVFEELLYADAGGVTLLDSYPVGPTNGQTVNLETPSPYLASATLASLVTDPVNNAVQQFLLTLTADASTGVTKTSYANVADLSNGRVYLAGPWTYTGSGTSFPVTLTGENFNITTAGASVSASFAVTLLDETQSKTFNSLIPTGSPMMVEAPNQYIYRSSGYNNVACQNLAEDGNCQAFTFNAYVTGPGSGPITTYLKLVDLTASGGPVTLSFPPVTVVSFEPSYTILPQQVGLTTPGQIAVSQVFEELLYADAGSVTLLDSYPLGTLNLETPSPYLASSSILSLVKDPNNQATQQFSLTLNANAPSGVTKTSYANVADLSNGRVYLVGPWTYTGSGSSYSVTLTGENFNITTAGASVTASFAVTLLGENQTTVYNSSIPSGSPITVEAPNQYIFRSSSYSNVACQNLAEDGNCQAFTFNTYLTGPGSGPITTYLKLVDLTASGGPVTLSFPPVTVVSIEPGYTILPQQFGLTTPGQIAVSQVFEELLYADAGSVTLLDSYPLGTLNLETPSPYLGSATLSCLQSDPNNQACQQVLLTLNPVAPAGVTKTSYANVADLSNGKVYLVGPFTYAGAGSYSVTLNGFDFNITTAGAPVTANFAVTLLAENQTTVFNSLVPAGSPMTVEAPIQYLYHTTNNNLSCLTYAEDGNCETFNLNFYVDSPSGTVTTYMRLVDLSAAGGPVTANCGAVTDNGGGTDTGSFSLLAQQFGLTSPAQIAVSQVFEELLYADAAGVTLLDAYPVGSLNLETPSPYLASANLSCLQSDPNNQACQQLLLTLNAVAPSGVTKTSYANVVDLTNGKVFLIGPWTYTGSGTSYSVTLNGSDFNVMTAGATVSTNFAVTLLDETQAKTFNSLVPTGSPVTFEAPEQYINRVNSSLSCLTSAEDGNCETFNYALYVNSPSGASVTTYTRIVDLTSGGGPVTVNCGAVTDNGGGGTSSSYSLSAQQFGLSSPGQIAVSQVFEALLYADAGGVTLLDSYPLKTLNLETPSPYITGSALTCLTSDSLNQACQVFQLLLNLQGAAGAYQTNYAYLGDATNGNRLTLGPFSYTGSGSFAVTLSGRQLGLGTLGFPVSSQLAVTLLNGAQNKVLGVSFPAGGAPATLETPPGYINSTSLNYQTRAEDGNWNTFTFYFNAYTPGSATTLVGMVLLWDTTNGNSVTEGPVTYSGNSYSWTITAAQLGLAPGQAAVNQQMVAQLYDSTGTKLYDASTLGAFNLEGSEDTLSSSAVTCLTTDSVNGACQAFQLTLNANSPAGVSQLGYARVYDLTNGQNILVGPWSFTGTGTGYAVTLSGYDLGFTTPNAPASASMAVTFYNEAQNQILSVGTPTGSPFMLEEPPAYIDYASLAAPVSLLAEDGNATALNLTFYAYTPGCTGSQTSLIRLVDTTTGTAVTLGPQTYTCGSWVFPVSASQFGLAPGQAAVSQAFTAELWNAAGTSVWDTKTLGTFNIEGP